MGRKLKELLVIENLLITDAGAEGVCIGKHEGRIVFVSNVVPGDVVDVEVYKKKHSYYHARVKNLKSLSKHRQVPKCEHFGVCGGCKWQNMNYETQLYYKQKQVQDHFSHIGRFNFPEIQPILPSEKIYAYRNKVEYTFSDRRWLTNEEMANISLATDNLSGLGYHLPGLFDKILDIHHCDLHDETGNEIRKELKEFAQQHKISFYNARTHEGLLRNLIIRTSVLNHLMVIVVFSAYNDKTTMILNFLKEKFAQITSLMYVINTKLNDSISDLEVKNFYGENYMIEQMGDLRFKVAPLAFYQTNAQQAQRLYQVVKQMANIKNTEIVYDLYTGTGTIALFIAHQAQKVIGIEYVDSAVDNAKENAEINLINNAFFFAGDMAKIFTDDFINKNGKPHVIITDPPRSGMHPDVIAQILKILPQRIVYVSCNSATQARDIAMLISHYQVEKTQPVDMFPHTHHVENVCLLTLR